MEYRFAKQPTNSELAPNKRSFFRRVLRLTLSKAPSKSIAVMNSFLFFVLNNGYKQSKPCFRVEEKH